MKILLVSFWYHPEPVTKPHNLAVALVERGHAVTVIAGFPNYPEGRVYSGYRMRLYQRETIDGVNILRVVHLVDHSRSAFRRILAYLTFALAAASLGAVLTLRPDVIWSYQVGLPGVLLAAIKRAPLVHEVQDLWPDWGRTATHGLHGWLFSLLAAQERLIYRRAKVVTTISEGFRRALLARGVPACKIALTANWADDALFRPVAQDPELGEREGLAGKFNVVYGGNIGVAQDLGVALEAAHQLQDLPQVQFVLIGDGAERQALSRRAQQSGLANVRFLGPRRPEEMAGYFAYADVLLLPLAQDPAYAITIPSKTYAYLASGRPILAAADGDVAQLIRTSGAGAVCAPHDAVALASMIRDFVATTAVVRDAFGQLGRQAFLTRFAREPVVAQYAALFTETTAEASPQSATAASEETSGNQFDLRPATGSDVPAIVAVHIASFQGFFLTFLGQRFLTVLYDSMLAMPDAIAIVAVDENEKIAGFVVGTISQRSLYRCLLAEHWLAFGWAALGAVVRRPSTVVRLLRALQRPAEATESAADCLLASIAVLPAAQGKHIGAALVRAFLHAAALHGAGAVTLTTDADGNDAVNRFYRHLGFRLARSFITPEGRPMNEYVIGLPIEQK